MPGEDDTFPVAYDCSLQENSKDLWVYQKLEMVHHPTMNHFRSSVHSLVTQFNLFKSFGLKCAMKAEHPRNSKSVVSLLVSKKL